MRSAIMPPKNREGMVKNIIMPIMPLATVSSIPISVIKGKSETLDISELNIDRFKDGKKGLGSEKAVF